MKQIGPYTVNEEEYDIVRDMRLAGASQEEIDDALRAYAQGAQEIKRNYHLSAAQRKQQRMMGNKAGLLKLDWKLQDPSDATIMKKYIEAVGYKIELRRIRSFGHITVGFGEIFVSKNEGRFIPDNVTGWKTIGGKTGNVGRELKVRISIAGTKKYKIEGSGYWRIGTEGILPGFSVNPETKDLRWDLDKDGFAVLATIQKFSKELDRVGSEANFWKWGSLASTARSHGTYFKKGEQYVNRWD
jgi:hypothetical protein